MSKALEYIGTPILLLTTALSNAGCNIQTRAPSPTCQPGYSIEKVEHLRPRPRLNDSEKNWENLYSSIGEGSQLGVYKLTKKEAEYLTNFRTLPEWMQKQKLRTEPKRFDFLNRKTPRIKDIAFLLHIEKAREKK